MCLMWWSQQRPRREEFISQAMSHLLIKAVDDGSTVTDVHRVSAIRDAYDLIDMDEPSSGDIKQYVHASYMTLPSG